MIGVIFTCVVMGTVWMFGIDHLVHDTYEIYTLVSQEPGSSGSSRRRG